MKLKSRFRLIVAVATAGLLAMAGFWLRHERARLLASRIDRVNSLTSVALAVITQEHELEATGKISRGEAQARAIELVRAIRFESEDYFWINDMHPTMVMHPTLPQLEGTDLTNYRDPDGKALFAEMAAAVKRDGEGLVAYRWPKPGEENLGPVRKISYVRGFAPWGWVIGTGIYVDDIETKWRSNAEVTAVLGLVCLTSLLLVSTRLSRSIFQRLDVLVGQMDRIATGQEDFSQSVAPRNESSGVKGSKDEIGILLAGFGRMLEHIRTRDRLLLGHQEALEDQVVARTLELATAHSEIELFLQCIPSILIGLDLRGRVVRWNQAVVKTFGISGGIKDRRLDQCGIKWLHPDMAGEIDRWLDIQGPLRCDIAFEKEQNERFVGLTVRPILSEKNRRAGFLVTGTDITEKRELEDQLRQAHKLEAIGQLAAGVAHEINTPTQFVGDNTTFLKQSWEPILRLLNFCQTMWRDAEKKNSVSAESLAEFNRLCENCDLEYLLKEIPLAIDQSLEGLQRVARIVRAMKEFAHPGSQQKEPVDINRAIEATVTVARSEWKHVAEVEMQLAPDLPLVFARGDELRQVILNLLVNAAHAVGDAVEGGAKGKGKITIRTRRDGEYVLISLADTGTGIPEEHRARVFEPFFTSKPVGKGTGQGLSLAHTVIVKGHQGQIWFETELGKGTTFFIRLRQAAQAQAASAN